MGKRRVEKKRDVAELSLLMENLDRFEAPLTHHCETCISVAAACAKGKARGCVDRGEEAHRNSATVLSKCAWRHCHVLANLREAAVAQHVSTRTAQHQQTLLSQPQTRKLLPLQSRSAALFPTRFGLAVKEARSCALL